MDHLFDWNEYVTFVQLDSGSLINTNSGWTPSKQGSSERNFRGDFKRNGVEIILISSFDFLNI